MLTKGESRVFLGSLANPDEASSLLIGAPFDGTTSFLPGTRMGPGRIREASVGLETYSPLADRSLDEVALGDLGDLELPFGDVSEALERIEAASRSVLSVGGFPIVLGGEHLVSLPAVRACRSYYQDLAVIQFDAHADLRSEYLGQEDSHATVMRRIGEIVGPDSVFQIGIRSGTREEFSFGRTHSLGFFPELFEGIARAVRVLQGRPVYITFDVDVIDPAFAPGTGTPEPGGYTPKELFQALHRLQELDVVGFDLVEVNPLVDHGVVTAILGAKIVREALLVFSPRADRF